MPHKANCHPIKCDIFNDVNLFPTVYSGYTATNYQFIQSDTELQWLASALEFILTFILMLDLKLCPTNLEGGGIYCFWCESRRRWRQRPLYHFCALSSEPVNGI